MIHLSHRLAPLGIETALVANQASLLQAAIASFDWCESGCPDAEAMVTLRLSLGHPAQPCAQDAIAVRGARLNLAGDGYDGWADADLLEAACVVDQAMCDDPARLATLVLEPLLLFLLTRAGRPPIHAAGIMAGGGALVLAGPSGSGKSTLALTASRRGLQVLSEDSVYVEIGERPRLWGWPGPIHICEREAPPGKVAVRLRGGKRKAAILPAATCLEASARALIVLERGDCARLERIDAAMAIQQAMKLEEGFDLLQKQIEEAITALARAGPSYRLTLSGDPEAAMDLLETEFAVPVRAGQSLRTKTSAETIGVPQSRS